MHKYFEYLKKVLSSLSEWSGSGTHHWLPVTELEDIDIYDLMLAFFL